MSEAFLVRRGGSGGGAGATLTVNAPVGATAKIVQDDKTKTKTVAENGTAVFSGITGGQWLASISDATHAETTPVPVTVTTDYAVTLSFFSATINVTYPSGSTCTVSKGGITLTAPDTSGVWDCVVPEAGTWTVTATNGTHTTNASVVITEQEQIESVELAYSLRAYDYGYSVGTWEIRDFTDPADAKVTFQTDHIAFGYNQAKIQHVRLNKKYDITNYSTLTVKGVYKQARRSQNTKSYCYVSLDEIPASINFLDSPTWANYNASCIGLPLDTSGTVGDYTLDISSLTGEHWIGIIMCGVAEYYQVILS